MGVLLTLRDGDGLRDLLSRLLPGLEIENVVRPSGQRLVYFCKFGDVPDDGSANGWRDRVHGWGDIVLKVTEELNPAQIAYLQKEIEILNGLNSPFYPKLHYNEVFSEDPDTERKFERRIFVTVEERINALPLTDRLASFQTERTVVELMQKLAEALCLLWNHPNRLVHRDIKPDNILIRDNGDIVVIDLGILREEGSPGLTSPFVPWGPCTPCYASPEQARNDKKNISFKSDFFSLGVLAYQLLSGTNPFLAVPDDGIHATLDRVVNLNPPTLHSTGKASEPVSRLVERLMMKQPYQRFRTVPDFRDALAQVRGGLG